MFPCPIQFPNRFAALVPSLPICHVFQFLEEREMGRNSTLVPPPSLQRFIGADGFAAFVGEPRPSKRSR